MRSALATLQSGAIASSVLQTFRVGTRTYSFRPPACLTTKNALGALATAAAVPNNESVLDATAFKSEAFDVDNAIDIIRYTQDMANVAADSMDQNELLIPPEAIRLHTDAMRKWMIHRFVHCYKLKYHSFSLVAHVGWAFLCLRYLARAQELDSLRLPEHQVCVAPQTDTISWTQLDLYDLIYKPYMLDDPYLVLDTYNAVRWERVKQREHFSLNIGVEVRQQKSKEESDRRKAIEQAERDREEEERRLDAERNGASFDETYQLTTMHGTSSGAGSAFHGAGSSALQAANAQERKEEDGENLNLSAISMNRDRCIDTLAKFIPEERLRQLTVDPQFRVDESLVNGRPPESYHDEDHPGPAPGQTYLDYCENYMLPRKLLQFRHQRQLEGSPEELRHLQHMFEIVSRKIHFGSVHPLEELETKEQWLELLDALECIVCIETFQFQHKAIQHIEQTTRLVAWVSAHLDLLDSYIVSVIDFKEETYEALDRKLDSYMEMPPDATTLSAIYNHTYLHRMPCGIPFSYFQKNPSQTVNRSPVSVLNEELEEKEICFINDNLLKADAVEIFRDRANPFAELMVLILFGQYVKYEFSNTNATWDWMKETVIYNYHFFQRQAELRKTKCEFDEDAPRPKIVCLLGRWHVLSHHSPDPENPAIRTSVLYQCSNTRHLILTYGLVLLRDYDGKMEDGFGFGKYFRPFYEYEEIYESLSNYESLLADYTQRARKRRRLLLARTNGHLVDGDLMPVAVGAHAVTEAPGRTQIEEEEKEDDMEEDDDDDENDVPMDDESGLQPEPLENADANDNSEDAVLAAIRRMTDIQEDDADEDDDATGNATNNNNNDNDDDNDDDANGHRRHRPTIQPRSQPTNNNNSTNAPKLAIFRTMGATSATRASPTASPITEEMKDSDEEYLLVTDATRMSDTSNVGRRRPNALDHALDRLQLGSDGAGGGGAQRPNAGLLQSNAMQIEELMDDEEAALVAPVLDSSDALLATLDDEDDYVEVHRVFQQQRQQQQQQQQLPGTTQNNC
jgi:hypothetical protein